MVVRPAVYVDLSQRCFKLNCWVISISFAFPLAYEASCMATTCAETNTLMLSLNLAFGLTKVLRLSRTVLRNSFHSRHT